MIAYPNRNLTLALAGVLQSAKLVYQLAKIGNHDQSALRDSSVSLIRLDAKTTEEVYGSARGVELGLKTIVKVFANKPDVSTRDVYQYAVSVHQLGIKLAKLKKTSDIIHGELVEIQEKCLNPEYDDEDYPEFLEALANLYSRTISYLTPRIIVQGSSGMLQEPETVNQVRCALFSGIRSAYLWHQLGGRRWQLLFNRKGYVSNAEAILDE